MIPVVNLSDSVLLVPVVVNLSYSVSSSDSVLPVINLSDSVQPVMNLSDSVSSSDSVLAATDLSDSVSSDSDSVTESGEIHSC